MDWDRKDQECNCCIEVKNSLCIIICRDLDEKDLRNAYQTFVELKSNE